MTQQPGTTGETYDQFSAAGTTMVLGGNIHVGYWDDDLDVPIEEATDRLTDLVADRLTLRPGMHLLDVGCGNGFPAVRIAGAHNVRVTGITVSEKEVETASALAEVSAVSFRLADVTRLPFGDAVFDGAFAIESLLHVADQTIALKELYRVVRHGGLLVIADLCQREPFTGEGRALLEGMLDTLHIARINSVREHRARLAEAGWKVLELLEIGEKVRPSYGHVSAAFRGIAASLPTGAADQITIAADLMAAFGEHPHAGYVLIIAQRS